MVNQPVATTSRERGGLDAVEQSGEDLDGGRGRGGSAGGAHPQQPAPEATA
ncbi:MAG TPA: hypothetical protein VES42_02775 [Pilimelia sp.]|nr:hypothetical protein [Pilimelia sp.]